MTSSEDSTTVIYVKQQQQVDAHAHAHAHTPTITGTGENNHNHNHNSGPSLSKKHYTFPRVNVQPLPMEHPSSDNNNNMLYSNSRSPPGQQQQSSPADAADAADGGGGRRRNPHHNQGGGDESGGGGGPHAFSSSQKRKRGKYIARACLPCQQRKIRCEGGQPCAQCAAKNRVCITTPRASDPVKQDPIPTSIPVPIPPEPVPPPPVPIGGSQAVVPNVPDESPFVRDLLTRVAQLERQLRMLSTAPLESSSTRHPALSLHRSPAPTEDHRTPESLGLQSVLEPDGQAFAGEASLDTNARSVLDQISASVASSTAFRPSSQYSEHPSGRTGKVRGWLERIFAQHGLYADQTEWRKYLRVFFDQVHILYPFLHPNWVWQTFDEMWEYSALWNMCDPGERERKRMAVALVCFCLAIGRCNFSTRMEDVDGVQSAGWTLYSAGMSLIPDMPEPSDISATSLLGFQISVVRVMYLFRLDAGQKSARLLAGVITNAHIVGLHRRKTLEDIPVFNAQLFCRLWWAIYAIDRRLALESGRPYLIQDTNVDAALPLAVSDEWMSRFALTQQTAAQLQNEIAVEAAHKNVTFLPYVETMISLYGIVGRAWPFLYGLKTSNTEQASAESLDTAISELMNSVPRNISYRPDVGYREQFEGSPHWQVKQAMLTYTFCSFLRLLIRRPYALRSESANRHFEGIEDGELDFAAFCTNLAGEILIAHDNVADEEIKFCFPYIHDLISATMVMSNLLTRHPSLKQQYENVLRRAVMSLNTYCYKVWVSGKLMRTVSDLDALVRTVLTDGATHAQRHRLQRMYQGDNATATPEEQDSPQSSEPMDEDSEYLGPRSVFSGGVAGSDELRDDQSISLHSMSDQPRFRVSAMADFDFESMIMGTGGVPVTYPPDDGRRIVMMFGQANAASGSHLQGGVFPPGRMTDDTAIYRPLIPHPNGAAIQSSIPPGGMNPYSTADGGF